jgi:hypothetical protein
MQQYNHASQISFRLTVLLYMREPWLVNAYYGLARKGNNATLSRRRVFFIRSGVFSRPLGRLKFVLQPI